jgi:peptide deformylase
MGATTPHVPVPAVPKLKLVLWPADVLKRVCSPVDPSSDTDFRAQLEEMKKVMQAHGGIGLAANQVGLTKRMLVAFKPGEGPVAFVNPRIVAFSGTWELMREGCLSIPGVVAEVKRNTEVIVESLDIDTGAMFVSPYSGVVAHVLQHEIEHLDGKMMIDKLPGGQKDQIRAHMRRLKGGRR